MAGMLEDFARDMVAQEIKDNYPHIKYPQGVYAKVVAVTENTGKYICTLRILNRAMNFDKNFPEIPGVKTDLKINVGDTVVLMLLYGGSDFYILGRMADEHYR